MAELRLYHAADPEALLLHAAAPLLVAGRPAEPLPLLVLRQGTLRDEVMDRAARAGCVGWLGEPLVVFAELPARLGVEQVPLSARERGVLLRRLAREHGLEQLERALARPRLLQAVDALIGDLHAERVAPAQLTEAMRAVQEDGWDARRNEQFAALYRAYLDVLPTLPRRHGIPRSDGRDGLALAAELLRERPEVVRARLRRPFTRADAPCELRVVGLMDLRRGWRLLLDALHASDVVGSLCVYLPTADDASEREALSDHEVWDYVAPRAASVERISAAAREPALGALHDLLFRSGPQAAPPAACLRGVAAPDEEREAAEIARRVKRLIVQRGAVPDRIAVVMRESRPCAPIIAAALARLGVPVSARLRYAATDAGAVGALLNVLHAAGHGWTLSALLRVAQSPYFDVRLDLGTLRWVGAFAPLASLDAWDAALAALAARDPASEDDQEAVRGAPAPARAKEALAGLRAFAERAAPLSEPRPLSRWIETTRHLLGIGGEWPAGLWGLRRHAERVPGTLDDAAAVNAVRLDCHALEALAALLADWAAALSLDAQCDPLLDAAAWHDELRGALEAQEVVLLATHQRGVQVLEAFAAVGRPWDHLFVVGMSNGAFPADPASRPLYSDHERAQLHDAGLPLDTREVWYGREAALFRALVGTARRSLTLSYAYAGADGGVRLPSAYFDEVRDRVDGADEEWIDTIPGSHVAPRSLDDVASRAELMLFAARAWPLPELHEPARSALAHLRSDPDFAWRVEHLLHTARVQVGRTQAAARPARHEAAHPWNGRIDDEALRAVLEARFGDAVWSVSRLEAYGNCPWSFFAKHVLHLEAVSEPEDDLDAASRGSLLHLCLERVHRALAAEFGDDALNTAHLARADELIAEAVPRAFDELARRGWMGSPALRPSREQEVRNTLRRYIRWEMQQNEKEHHTRPLRRAPRHFELTFGMNGEPAAELESGGRRLRLRGIIDRVDEIVDERARGWLYVTDHKSGASALKPSEKYGEGAILQLPLYLQVVQQRNPAAPGLWGGAYQVVGDRARVAPLHLVSYTKARGVSGEGNTQRTAQAHFDAALEHALAHVDAITRGIFPARIPACVKRCPSYCDFKDICREDRQGEDHT